MTLVQRFPNAPQNYDAQNEAQFRNMVRQAFSDASSPVVLTESVGQSFEATTGGTPTAGDALVYASGVFTATKIFTGAMTFSAALTATAGGSLTGTWSDMGSVTTIDINGGSIDGTPIGAASPSTGAFSSVDIDGGTLDGVTIGGTTPGAGTFTTLNATGGGALTGTWTNLGSVTTVDINGGTIDGAAIGATTPSTGAFTSVDIDGGTLDGVTIGGTTPGAGTFTSLNATGGGALTGTWSNLGTVTTVDINGGTIDGAAIGASSPSTGAFSSVDINGGTIDGATIGGAAAGAGTFTTLVANTSLSLGDDVFLYLGAGSDYWFEYDSTATALQLWSTNADGIGTDGRIFQVVDGTDDIQFFGNVRIDGILRNDQGVALGGGASATLGTIGGSGPTVATQNQWLQIDIGGTSYWVPVWL